MTHLNQVGQTGVEPAPSQGPRHLLPRRGAARRRLALHPGAPRCQLNPNCGWAQGKADVLYVADAFEVIEKVNASLRRQPSGPSSEP
jgi:electron transfer flavoprotein alpha subunit